LDRLLISERLVGLPLILLFSCIQILEILDVILFQLLEPTRGDLSPGVQSMREELKADELLESDATVEEGGVYRYSERGDRLLDVAALSEALMQVRYKLDY
jgi:nuclear pore complex protein Nup205